MPSSSAHEVRAEALLQRLKALDRPVVQFTLDGQPARALLGDTVMTAILTQGAQLRTHEFSQLPRAGFCLMGACQDCWVRLADGRSIRACQSLLEPGMVICTNGAQRRPGP
ncbi:(2Fe-2S)-binding protein [Vandammella animalimorsus]|uniref:Ferredoxin n=1 Tax=Vandammella animalimorsus TaxID=2029117 RepID=A0A2A2A6R3_9BURK|nr:(2Fe-2S)-binding protein [Vandammella animalimorsus]PAT34220.1 ferredoxin [Vandammella animalimorsus]